MDDAKKVMMTFVNMYSQGLKILATHRVLKNLDNFDLDRFLQAAQESFTISRFGTDDELRARARLGGSRSR